MQPAAQMRHALFLILAACNPELASRPDASPASVRERLDDQTRLIVKPLISTGAIVAERYARQGWETHLVELTVDTGDLVVHASGDAITLGQIGVRFRPLEIPSAVFGGHSAQLEHLHIELLDPVTATALWTDDNAVTFSAMLELGLSWSLVIDGAHAPLGSPRLPRVPVDVTLTGNGNHIEADLRAQLTGELWSWAGLIRLANLELMVSAETSAPGEEGDERSKCRDAPRTKPATHP